MPLLYQIISVSPGDRRHRASSPSSEPKSLPRRTRMNADQERQNVPLRHGPSNFGNLFVAVPPPSPLVLVVKLASWLTPQILKALSRL